jgi:lysophospholipase L1-like esterase
MRRVVFISLLLATALVDVKAQYSRASLWTSDLVRFAREDSIQGCKTNCVLFVGSSTFTRWTTVVADFPESNILNRAFGGSTLTDLIYYFDQIIAPHNPSQVVIYEGDNDLADSAKSVGEFINDVIAITRLVNIHFPKAKILLVSIKLSPSRSEFFYKYQKANELMRQIADSSEYIDFVDTCTPMLNPDGSSNREFFSNDMLHLNGKGYSLWKSLLYPWLLKAGER